MEKEFNFSPLKDFSVYKGIGYGSSPTLPFPGYLYYSSNFYDPGWRLSSIRRLKNVICVLDWLPDVDLAHSTMEGNDGAGREMKPEKKM